MVALNKIDAFASEVAKKIHPEKIVLFGSYAQGQPTEDSDVDLLVVMEHKGKSSEQALAIRRAVRRSFPLDLIVRTPRETQARLKQCDVFITSALTEGRTLYERADLKSGLQKPKAIAPVRCANTAPASSQTTTPPASTPSSASKNISMPF